MPGFPVRPSRVAFGPTRIDDGVVTDHEHYVDAPTFNLGYWQTAGLGVVCPAAWAVLEWDGATLNVLASGECWDPTGVIVPVAARVGAGDYTLTYPATGVDELGATVPIAFNGGMAIPQVNTADHLGSAVPQATAYVVDIDIKTIAGAAQDHKVLVLLW